jgi:cobalt-zinc-cadmium efflux system membrane fusion protein
MKTRNVLVAFGLVASIVAVGCRRQAAFGQPEPTTLNVTHWSDKTELYMEYPPLVTQQNARFAVHLTRLNDFKAIDAGRPSLEFMPETGGSPIVVAGSAPLRPGAFRIEGPMPAVGRYRWALTFGAPGLSDRHDLGTVTVFADKEHAKADAEARPGDDPSAIAYLKEQQWTNPFSTVPVREAELRTSVRVPGTIEALTGGEATVAAPVSGRFAAASLLPVGSNVRAGEALGRIEPRLQVTEDRATLAAAVAEAQAQTDAARADQARAERLLAERAVPGRRVEEAQRAVTIAEARLRAAQSRLAQRDETLRSGGGAAGGNAFVLRAPIEGRIVDVDATLGASYEEGATLFKIVRTDRVELRVQVPAADATIARNIDSIGLEIAGRSDPVELRPRHVHDPGVLDAQTHALPLQFQVDNSAGQLFIGQSGTAVLYQRARQRVVAVPKAAVLMEAGRPYVFVQVGGERFARRPIEIATRDGDLIGVRSGVKPGERVVTRGAYEVQLASAAKGLPAEGHVH